MSEKPKVNPLRRAGAIGGLVVAGLGLGAGLSAIEGADDVKPEKSSILVTVKKDMPENPTRSVDSTTTTTEATTTTQPQSVFEGQPGFPTAEEINQLPVSEGQPIPDAANGTENVFGTIDPITADTTPNLAPDEAAVSDQAVNVERQADGSEITYDPATRQPVSATPPTVLGS